MFQQQFAAIFEVAVNDINEGLSEIRQAEQQLLFHAFPIAVGNLVSASLGIELIGEELLLMAELFGEERMDERDVVMDTPRLEYLFFAEPWAHVPSTLR